MKKILLTGTAVILLLLVTIVCQKNITDDSGDIESLIARGRITFDSSGVPGATVNIFKREGYPGHDSMDTSSIAVTGTTDKNGRYYINMKKDGTLAINPELPCSPKYFNVSAFHEEYGSYSVDVLSDSFLNVNADLQLTGR